MHAKLIKKIYKAFSPAIRPDTVVDNPKHCLACEETYEAHKNLRISLKQVSADDFRLCYISLDALTSNGLQYYMPRLLELLLDGADYTQGILADSGFFMTGLLKQLVPEKDKDRFTFYTKAQIDVIIEVLKVIRQKYYRDSYEPEWNWDEEKMESFGEEKEIVELCDNALEFWNKKL